LENNVATSRADLILHPVRMRLIVTLARRQLTTRQLSEALPDVPQATLYHHLGTLTRGGLLRIVSERQVRGTVEKVYAIAEDNATLSQADLAQASRDDHLRYFTVFVATLLDGFARYLQQDAAIDLLRDGAGYKQVPFYLSDDEFVAMVLAFNRALLPYLANEPSPERRRRLFTTILFPDPASTASVDEGRAHGASGITPGD
jgi:DNA-binding transcriptional ArsR family regulator